MNAFGDEVYIIILASIPAARGRFRKRYMKHHTSLTLMLLLLHASSGTLLTRFKWSMVQITIKNVVILSEFGVKTNMML